MIRSGLCSVTFWQLSVAQVVDIAVSCGLEGIEWGGDIHVPVGDKAAADDARGRCMDHGITCASYGSYLGIRAPIRDPEPALDTAVALGAPNVRVWCPLGVDVFAAERTDVTAGIARTAESATRRGLTVSLEYHPGTLTETSESTMRLLAEVDAPNLFTYWQPAPGGEASGELEELNLVRPRLSHLHVFTWDKAGTRLPLALGAGLWPAVFSSSGPGDRFAFLEFVAGDDPAQLVADAATLKGWLAP